MTRTLSVLLDDLTFGEGPRWRGAQLYFSDFYDGVVKRVDMVGNAEIVAQLPQQPSGLGWLPDGRMLVVSMIDQKILCLEGKTLTPYADLSALASFHCNDMVVDAQGRAYVGNFGFNSHKGEAPRPTNLILVRPEDPPEIAAPDMMFPNGTVITPDGKTLIIGETFAARLTAFDIDETGRLRNRRVWADMAAHPHPQNGQTPVPDGICLDAEGAVWVASPTTNEVLRLAEGGDVLDRIDIDRGAFACMLGGEDGKTLFICAAKSSDPKDAPAQRQGQILMTQVDIPHAGLP